MASEVPIAPPPVWLINNLMQELGEDCKSNAAKHPYVFMNFVMIPTILICDPEGAQDLFVTNNKFSDKAPGIFRIV